MVTNSIPATDRSPIEDLHTTIICPECKTKITDTPGQGMHAMVEIIEKRNLPINILKCPRCKLKYPDPVNEHYRICFRCHVPLVNASHIKNIGRKIYWESTFLRNIFKYLLHNVR